MRNLKKYILLSLIFLFLCLLPYLLKFNNGLSSNQNDFGSFGSYFGGIFGPILTFLTIIILIRTNDDQTKQFRHQSIRNQKDSYSIELLDLLNINLSELNIILKSRIEVDDLYEIIVSDEELFNFMLRANSKKSFNDIKTTSII